MKISPTEHKIKKKLSNREILPSKELWDNIQQELDIKQSKPNQKTLWIKLASMAAVVCIAFIVYQNLFLKRQKITHLVLQSKSIEITPLQFQNNTINPIIKQNFNTSLKPNKIIRTKPHITIESSIAKVTNNEKPTYTNANDEVEKLLQEANKKLALTKSEKYLQEEVNTLLHQAIAKTVDKQQKSILQNINTRLLLSEIEAEMELQKPQKLKDKIWEALVSNLNNIKDAVVSN